jgi:hypothetical protein
VFVALLLMRSPLVGNVVGSSVKQLTGCTLEGTGTTGAYIGLDGRLVLNHFQLRLPGIPGEAGEVLRAEQGVVDLDWSGALKGEVRPTAIRLSKPVFRVSQCVEDGELNIGSLAAKSGVGSGAGAVGGNGGTIPKIDAMDGTIIFAEHAKATGASRTLKELHVSGGFLPVDAGRPAYSVRFAETGQVREKALLLDGRVKLDTGESQITLFNLALDTWTPESVPAAYRDVWRRMNVQGRIASATMRYDREQGARADVVLEDVSMNALIPAEGSGPGAMRDMGLEGVSGTIRFSQSGLNAELTGKLGGQSGVSSMTLKTTGMGIDAALSCEIVAKRVGLARETELLPYMPEQAKQYFRLFSGPTGEIDARVLISRGAPIGGAAAPIQISGGRIALRHGRAAFSRFAYPFEDLSGWFEFDDRTLRIVRIEGRGPTGATLRADGLIAPLTDEAMVDVNVHAEHVPVDAHLLDAMPPDRRRVLENIFSRPEHARLVADGLVRSPGSPENAGAPEFALGGEAEVDVHVHSAEGKGSRWSTIVDVRFAEAGMLAEAFPLPVVARDVKLHITDDAATLVSGAFAPLSGGTMAISATVAFPADGARGARGPTPPHPAEPPIPDVRIIGSEIPVDRLLLRALPRDDAAAGASARDLSIGELLHRINASGTVDCDARVTTDPGAPAEAGVPRIDYDVSVDLGRIRAAPTLPGERPVFSLEDFHGGLRVTRSTLSVPKLEARLFRVPEAEGDIGRGALVGPLPCANFSLVLEKQLGGGPGERGRMDGSIAVSQAMLSAPIERFVGVFSPELGRRLATMRAERLPSGRLHATVGLHRPAGFGAGTEFGVTLDNASNVEFAALGGRVGVDWPEGVIEIAVPAAGPERLRFDRLRARVALDGAPCGDIRLNGSVVLDPATGGVAAPADLTAEFADWRFQSPLIVPLLERLTSPGTAEAYRNFNAVGPFDASVRVSSGAEAGRAGDAPEVTAQLAPRAMAFDWENRRVVCDEVSGKVTLRTRAGEGSHPVSGRFDALAVKTSNWDASADGAWYAPPNVTAPGADRPVQLALNFGITGRKLDPALRALLPDSAVGAIDVMAADFRGPFALRRGAVMTTLGDEPSATTFTGDLDFQDLSLAVGAPIDRCTGTIHIRVDARPAGSSEPTTFRIDARADALRIVGVSATSARAEVVSGEKPGEILLPEIAAQCYGGRLAGHAKVQLPQTPDPAAHARYDAELTLAGVRLAPVLADAAAAGATDPGPVGPPNPFTEPDPSRGVIDARLELSGVSGDLGSRRGGGAIRVSNGDIIKLPVMLPLMQVSNFQVPSRDRLGYLQAEFAIQGDTALFDHVSLLSDSVTIVGAGTLKWPDLALDMKFNSRANTRIPVFSGLFEALRNEIVSTTVKGKLSSPLVREEPFTGTRRLLDRLLHPSAYAGLPASVPPSGKEAEAERRRTEHAAEATTTPNRP